MYSRRNKLDLGDFVHVVLLTGAGYGGHKLPSSTRRTVMMNFGRLSITLQYT